MLRTRLASVVTALVVAALAACSSSSDSGPDPTVVSTTTTVTTTPTSTTSAPGSASVPSTTPAASSVQIVSLTGPRSPVTCNAPSQMQLHWVARGASKVELRIDGGGVFATYPGGPRDPLVPLACDGEVHTYELTAHAANGQRAQRSLTIASRMIGVS